MLIKTIVFSNVFPDGIRENFKNGEYDPGKYLDILILNCYLMLNKTTGCLKKKYRCLITDIRKTRTIIVLK